MNSLQLASFECETKNGRLFTIYRLVNLTDRYTMADAIKELREQIERDQKVYVHGGDILPVLGL